MIQEEASKLRDENRHLKDEVERLKHIVQLFQKEKYGAKSERVEDIAEQLLFNEIEQEVPLAPVRENETITYVRRKGKKKRKPFPDNLPREVKVLDLADKDKICPHDGAKLKEIGEEVREKLKSTPARHSILIVKTKKYACPCCERHLAQAKSNSILPKTIATPELLSFIIFSKFFQSLPLYRLQELYKLNGIELKRGTMASWLAQISEKLIPIWNILEEKMLESRYVGIDATSVQVLKEKGRKAESKSFMWVRGSPELGIVLFDYDPSGGGRTAKTLMSGFKGALQADAHRGYRALDREGLSLLGCMMHSRRRFYKAWILAKKKPGIAQDALSMFNFIYGKEEEYRKKGLTPEERKHWRSLEVGPSLEEMKKWMSYEYKKVLPSSPIGNALNYFINEYEELTAFLTDGRYEIDNGWVERQIKRFAVGRKNWLFSGTVEGAKASSVLYSLTLTAKLNKKDPYLTMVEVLKRLPEAETIEDYERLAELFLEDPNLLSCRKKEGALIQ